MHAASKTSSERLIIAELPEGSACFICARQASHGRRYSETACACESCCDDLTKFSRSRVRRAFPVLGRAGMRPVRIGDSYARTG